MTKFISEVYKGGETGNPFPKKPNCPVCEATAIRNEQLLDALQTARFILSNRDGIKDPRIQMARIKAAVDEALKLLQPRRW